MNWWFKLITVTDNVYEYAYSRENKNLDGRIKYDANHDEVVFEKKCSNDRYSVEREAAIMHFWQVVEEGLPEERHICCG